MAFQAPRIIGQGQIQTPHLVDPIGDAAESMVELYDKKEDARRYEKDWDESGRRYEKTHDEQRRQYEKNFWEDSKMNVLRRKLYDLQVRKEFNKEYQEAGAKFKHGDTLTWQAGMHYIDPSTGIGRTLDGSNKDDQEVIGSTTVLDRDNPHHEGAIGSDIGFTDWMNSKPEYQSYMTPYSRELFQQDWLDWTTNTYSSNNPYGVAINPLSGQQNPTVAGNNNASSIMGPGPWAPQQPSSLYSQPSYGSPPGKGWGYGEDQWAPGKYLYKGAKGVGRGIGKGVGAVWDLFSGDARGRYIPGNRTGDKNPAMLEDGEYVLNREAVDAIGKEKLDMINYKKYPRFQTGGFNPNKTGAKAAIANPTILQSTAFDALAEGISQIPGGGGSGIRTDLGGNFDYDSLAGSGMSAPQYDALVQSRQDAWDPNWDNDDDWQQGGYIKAKGYQEGGFLNLLKPQSLSLMGNSNEPMGVRGFQSGGSPGYQSTMGTKKLMHKESPYSYTGELGTTQAQRDEMQYEMDKNIWETHRQRQAADKEMALHYKEQEAEYDEDYWARFWQPKEEHWYNPMTWPSKKWFPTEDQQRADRRKNRPQSYSDMNERWVTKGEARHASPELKEAIRSGGDWNKADQRAAFDALP